MITCVWNNQMYSNFIYVLLVCQQVQERPLFILRLKGQTDRSGLFPNLFLYSYSSYNIMDDKYGKFENRLLSFITQT